MTFELPEKGDTKSTEKPESLSFTGTSLKDDLSSFRDIDTKADDTSKDFLPPFKISGVDSETKSKEEAPVPNKTDIKPPFDPADQIDITKWKYNDWLTGAEDNLNFSPDDTDVKDTYKPEPKSDTADKVTGEGEPVHFEDSEGKESNMTIHLDEESEVEVDKDGRVKKITYVDGNGKRRTLTADQIKSAGKGKEFPGGFWVGHDRQGNATVQLPDGRVLLIDKNGRLKLNINPD